MPLNSDAPVRVDLALISGGQTVAIPAHLYFKSLSVEMTVMGSWTGSIELYDNQGDFLENLVIAAGLSRGVRFSFGRGTEVPEENLTFRGNITRYRPTFEPNGVSLVLEVVSTVVLPAIVDRNIRAFPAGLRISEMVEQLAAVNGWQVVDSQGHSTIEPTDGPFDEPFNSNGESDLAFIGKMLVPMAVNGSGVGDYFFFVDQDNVVHFHTEDYLNPVQHEFVYARAMAGDVISFAPSDDSLFGLLMGGGNSVFSGVSSAAAAPTRALSTSTGGVENTGFPVSSDAANRFDYGDGVAAYIDMSTRNPDELRRIAQVRYDKFRKYAFKADMQIHGSHRVKLHDWVNVRYLKVNPAPGASPEHYLSGRFRVYKTKHEVADNWTTAYEMMRSGMQVEGADPVQATQTLSPPTASVGGESIGVNVEQSLS